MRLTAELVEKSASFINPLLEREIDLRGNKIPAIENLGVTRDQYDTIDLTDNDIRRLENFPTLRRLRSLLVSNNHVSKFDGGLAIKLPKLEMLILSNNSVAELTDLDQLTTLKSLRYLSLIDNPVTKKPHYRLYVIAKMPWLRALDFKKISKMERQAAVDMLGPKQQGSKKRKRAKVFEPGEDLVKDEQPAAVSQAKRSRMSPEEIARIKEAIKSASNLQEVARLEKILQTGHVPETS